MDERMNENKGKQEDEWKQSAPFTNNTHCGKQDTLRSHIVCRKRKTAIERNGKRARMRSGGEDREKVKRQTHSLMTHD